MTVNQTLLEWIIFVEIALVFFIMVLTFIVKYIINMKEERDAKISQEMEKHFNRLIQTKGQLNPTTFPRTWKRLELLLLVVLKIDKTEKSPAWENIKSTLKRYIMLPLARKQATSYFGTHRFWAAKCFEMFMDRKDEDTVCHLMADKTLIIHLHAMIAGVKFASVKTINTALESMANTRRLGQTLYMQIFQMASPNIIPVIEKRIQTEKNPYILTCCYKILTLFPAEYLSVTPERHLMDSNVELQLAGIRYHGYTQKEKAIPLLIQNLKNEAWEIKAICCKMLGQFHATEALPELKRCLDDTTWVVRTNAENAIKQIENIQVKIPETGEVRSELYPQDTAVFVSNKPNNPTVS